MLPSSCDALVNYFSGKLKAAIDITAPAQLTKITSEKSSPFKTEDIVNHKKNCRKAERNWKKKVY